MISVAEARARLLGHITPLGAENVALEHALARSLAQAVIASRPQPPFAASAMDGYAVRAAETPGRLRVAGASSAGTPYARALNAGEAVRIFTGAPVPDGADAIAIQEDVRRDGDHIDAPATASGVFLRPAGLDFKAGAILLEPGRTLNGVAIALAAAAGAAQISVHRTPRIAILSGGEEIVPVGAHPGPVQIFDSASPGVAGLIAAWGGAPVTAAPLPDDAAALAHAAENALDSADLLVVIGGASVGDHDYARAALTQIGAELVFSGVAVRPGKPTWFALRDSKPIPKPILGLAGNPASALVCARLFLLPVIERMLGREAEASIAPAPARLKHALEANGPREHYLRGRAEIDSTGQVWVSCADDQDSSILSVFARADRLVIRPPHAPAAEAGALLETLIF